MGEQSRPRQPSSHASKPAPQAPPIAQSQLPPGWLPPKATTAVCGLHRSSGIPGWAGCTEADLLVVLGCGHHGETRGVCICGAVLHPMPGGAGEQLPPSSTARFSKALGVGLFCTKEAFAKGQVHHLIALRYFGLQIAYLSAFHHAGCVLASVQCQLFRQQSHPSWKTVARAL